MVALSVPDKSNQTVGQLVTQKPGRARVFEVFGIDYCCGGKKPLAQACAELGLNVKHVAGVLDLFDHQPSAADEETDWSKATLAELADHIEHTHHAYLKDELPRLEMIVTRVASRHGDSDPRLAQVRDIFGAFKAELEMHMMKEERVLFPICRQLAAAQTLPGFHCGSVQNPISVMIQEHDHAGDALADMRKLTDGFTPPGHACNTYRAMLDGLERLEQDMHRHVHKENSILFPAAEATERRLASLAGANLTI